MPALTPTQQIEEDIRDKLMEEIDKSPQNKQAIYNLMGLLANAIHKSRLEEIEMKQKATGNQTPIICKE